MLGVVRGYSSAAYETAAAAGRLSQVTGDVTAFARAVNVHVELRRILIDGAIPVALRLAVVTDLLEGRTAPESAAVLRFAVRHEPPGELPLSIADLVELAEECLACGDAVGSRAEPEGSRGEVRDRIGGYTERVLAELPGPDELDTVEDELFAVARAVDVHPDLRRVLADPAAELAGRLAVVDDLLGGKLSPPAMRLVRYVLRAGHVRDLAGTYEWLVELAALERGRRLAEARVAVDLDAGERIRLAAALGRLVDRPVELRVVIDPSVIGGMLVTVGDLVIDGTVRLRLERLRDLLAEAR
jgi:F-type H+-transporting ATPase subunit delta